MIPNEENPGYYSANVWLRPHFQLEGMDIGMSLVASLAEGKADAAATLATAPAAFRSGKRGAVECGAGQSFAFD